MKVLHLMSPGSIGGAEKSVLMALQALSTQVDSVAFAAIRETRCPHLAEQFCRLVREMDITHCMLDCKRRLDPGLWLRLRRLLRENPVDVLHAHGYKAIGYAVGARPAPTALVATFHGATSHDTKAKFYEQLEYVMYHKVDRVFVVSANSRARLLKRRVPKSRMSVVPNMVSLPLVSDQESVSPDADQPLRLLFLGRLSREKGLDVLLQALALAKADNGLWLDVVGDGPERSRLEDQTAALGLGEQVHFHGFQQDILKYLNGCHVLVMPSRTEGMPMTLLEATACGKPVVASDVGGIAEIVQHGKNGLLTSPDSPAELARSIRQMKARLQEFQGAAQDSATRIREEHSPGRWAQRAVHEYRDTLAKRRRVG